nr:zinc finger protein 808-like [Procambarus clarkii]
MDRGAQDHNKLFKCSQCDKAFNKKSSIVCHMRLHTGEKPFACTQCSSAFTHKSTLLHHLRLHTGEKPYECEICHKRFRQRSNYSLHKKIHTKEKSFECDICSKTFAQRVHLTTHKRLHTGEKPYVCKECNKRFSQRCHLNRHKTVHVSNKEYDCQTCDKKFSCSSHLRAHLIIHNGQHQQLKKSAYNHLVKEYGFNQSLSRNCSNEAKKQRSLECEFCHKRCIKKSHLRHHIFIHVGEKPYECIKCNRKFSEKGSLTRHMKVHSDTSTSSVPLTVDNIDKKNCSESKYVTAVAVESAHDMHDGKHMTELMPEINENKIENIKRPDLACSRKAGKYLTSLTRLDVVNVNGAVRFNPLAKKRRKILKTVLDDKSCFKCVTKDATIGQHLHMEPMGQQCEELVGQCIHGEPVGQHSEDPLEQRLHREQAGQQSEDPVKQCLHEEPVGQCAHEEPVILGDTVSGQEQVLTNKEELVKHAVMDTISNIKHFKNASKTEEYQCAKKTEVAKYTKTAGDSVGYLGTVNSKLKVAKQCSFVSEHLSSHKCCFNMDECESGYLSAQHTEEDGSRCSYFSNNAAPRNPLFSEIPVLSSEYVTSEEPVVSGKLLSLITELPDVSGDSLPLQKVVTSSESLPNEDHIDSGDCLPLECERTSSSQRDDSADRHEDGIKEVTAGRQAKGSGWSPSTQVIAVSMFVYGQQVKEDGGSHEVGIKQEVDVAEETLDDPRPTPLTQILSPFNTNP